MPMPGKKNESKENLEIHLKTKYKPYGRTALGIICGASSFS